jgi:hypothetical protein
MGLLDFSLIGDQVRMAPPRNAELIPILAFTDVNGDVTSISGYSAGEVPVSRVNGQYTFNVGIFSRILAIESSASTELASSSYAKVGEDSIRISHTGSGIVSGYLSFNAYVDREIG